MKRTFGICLKILRTTDLLRTIVLDWAFASCVVGVAGCGGSPLQKTASCLSVSVPLGRSVSSEVDFVIEMTPYPMFYSQTDARIRITFANVGKSALLFAEPRLGARTGPAVHFHATRNGEPVSKCRADLSSAGQSLLIPLGPGGDHSEWFWIGCLFEGPGEYEIKATVDFPKGSTRIDGVVAGSFVSHPIRFIWPEF